mmetsp:Transcript_2503/g.5812  ORF Transcript_2503/g.5812 Transcript_2503/m.5812 type:complete len:216 (-) Transcript_2503:375-1022(-)
MFIRLPRRPAGGGAAAAGRRPTTSFLLLPFPVPELRSFAPLFSAFLSAVVLVLFVPALFVALLVGAAASAGSSPFPFASPTATPARPPPPSSSKSSSEEDAPVPWDEVALSSPRPSVSSARRFPREESSASVPVFGRAGEKLIPSSETTIVGVDDVRGRKKFARDANLGPFKSHGLPTSSAGDPRFALVSSSYSFSFLRGEGDSGVTSCWGVRRM